MTYLMKRLGIDVPIIQAPMAGVATPALAAAVSNARALGSLGVGAMSVEAMRNAIRETRALTSRPFNVNVFCYAPPVRDPARDAAWLAYLAPVFARFGATAPTILREIYVSFNDNPAMLAALLEERPAVVSFHFGLPPVEFTAALRDAGIFLMASATNVDEAKQIEQAGIDAVIAQGGEAGGHRGMFDPDALDEELSTLDLTRLLVRKTNLPVIAAGGIMNGAGIATALAEGAQAAQLGTAFITCPESAADASYRTALLGPAAEQTAMTSAISGRLARGIVNGFTALGTASDRPDIPAYPVAYDAAKALQIAAKAAGNKDFVVQLAGKAARLSRAMPAAELVALLQTEYAEMVRS